MNADGMDCHPARSYGALRTAEEGSRSRPTAGSLTTPKSRAEKKPFLCAEKYPEKFAGK